MEENDHAPTYLESTSVNVTDLQLGNHASASASPQSHTPTSRLSLPNSPTLPTLPSYSEVNHSSPPASSSTTPSDPSNSQVFFDISPSSDATSFQVGYLGLKGFQAWIKGDVLVKFDQQSCPNGGYFKCSIQLISKEVIASAVAEADPVSLFQHEVVLFSSTMTLWDAQPAAPSSSSSATVLPSVMPFSFPLTPDLPHCIHLRNSSLTYQIEARLHSANPQLLPDAVKCIPVHVTRYTRPGPLSIDSLSEIDSADLSTQPFSLEPHIWTESFPTLAYVQLGRTIFRRAEPINIKFRIPPPSEQSVSKKGLKLRSVEADLIRTISAKATTSHWDGERAVAHNDIDLEQTRHPDPSSSITADQPLGIQESTAGASSSVVHEAVLAHSGKLCRFHSQKPVLLRLTIHPPFTSSNMPHPHPDHDALASGPVFRRLGGGGCESISQETVMHAIQFHVRIKIGMQGGMGERRDIVLQKQIRILPGAAGEAESQPSRGPSPNEKDINRPSEKARVALHDSSSLGPSAHALSFDFDIDQEYDGYEDVGEGIDELLNDTSGVGAPGPSSSHEERLEQLRQFLNQNEPSGPQDPPPSLLESQHDVQVEVEVEGVGLAMPRSHRRLENPFPNHMGDPDPLSLLAPPPPIDADDHDREFRDLSNLRFTERELDDPNDPPPPISPLLDLRNSSQSRFFAHSTNANRSFPELSLSHPAYSSTAGQIPETFDNEPCSVLEDSIAPPPPHSPPRQPPYSSHLDPEPSYETAIASHSEHALPPLSATLPVSNNLSPPSLSIIEPPPYVDSQEMSPSLPSPPSVPFESSPLDHSPNDIRTTSGADSSPPIEYRQSSLPRHLHYVDIHRHALLPSSSPSDPSFAAGVPTTAIPSRLSPAQERLPGEEDEEEEGEGEDEDEFTHPPAYVSHSTSSLSLLPSSTPPSLLLSSQIDSYEPRHQQQQQSHISVSATHANHTSTLGPPGYEDST